jgi:hypothetical protein
MILQFSWVLSQKQFASYVTTVEDILDIGSIDIIDSSQLPSVFSGEIASWTTAMLLLWKDALLNSH